MTKNKLLERLTNSEDEAVMIYVDADGDEGSMYIVDRCGFVKTKSKHGVDKAAIPLINSGALVCVARQWPSGNYIMRPALAKGA